MKQHLERQWMAAFRTKVDTPPTVTKMVHPNPEVAAFVGIARPLCMLLSGFFDLVHQVHHHGVNDFLVVTFVLTKCVLISHLIQKDETEFPNNKTSHCLCQSKQAMSVKTSTVPDEKGLSKCAVCFPLRFTWEVLMHFATKCQLWCHPNFSQQCSGCIFLCPVCEGALFCRNQCFADEVKHEKNAMVCGNWQHEQSRNEWKLDKQPSRTQLIMLVALVNDTQQTFYSHLSCKKEKFLQRGGVTHRDIDFAHYPGSLCQIKLMEDGQLGLKMKMRIKIWIDVWKKKFSDTKIDHLLFNIGDQRVSITFVVNTCELDANVILQNQISDWSILLELNNLLSSKG